MKPIQSPPAGASPVNVRPGTASKPKNSSNKVYFTHHCVEFVMGTEKNNEVAKVHCNGKEHLIDEVWQCRHNGHLMCRKCCFPPKVIIPETCPDHKTPVFLDKSTGRSIRSQRVTCPANETFNATCPWQGQYNEVTSHLNDCTFIPGPFRVTMQNAMLKAADQRAEQKYEELKQETARKIQLIQEVSDHRYETMECLSNQRFRDLMQKYNELANLLMSLPVQLTGQPVTIEPLAAAFTAPTATSIEEVRPPCCNGELIWPITNFSTKLELAKTDPDEHRYLESPAFYTSANGYKMRVKLYPNGDGIAKGTHISVFFQIMKGPVDGLLQWPFRQKVALMIMDQDQVEHVIDVFLADPKSSSFQRPRVGPNPASGCPTFMPHSDLANHGYLREGEDTLYIKVSVYKP